MEVNAKMIPVETISRIGRRDGGEQCSGSSSMIYLIYYKKVMEI
jgi:hypothetical protein